MYLFYLLRKAAVDRSFVFFAHVDAFENTQITKIASSNGRAGDKNDFFRRIFHTISIAVIFHKLFAQLALHTRNSIRNVEKRL